MTTKPKAPAKAEQVKAEALKAEQAKADELAKAELAKAEALKAEQAKAEEQAKADEAEKTVYQVKWKLLHNGKKYLTGDMVELTESEAKAINEKSTVLVQAPLAE